MESAEMVEMYRTLLPIARVDFGKEVFWHTKFSVEYTMLCLGKKYQWENPTNFGFARAGIYVKVNFQF